MIAPGEKGNNRGRSGKGDASESLAEFELREDLCSDYSAAAIPAQGKSRKLSVQARIAAMRRLANPRARSSYHLYIAKDAELFVQQAKALEDVEHQPMLAVSCRALTPTYEDLDDQQLNYYLSWRTKVRKGTIESTYLAYVYLYAFELINHIGVTDAADGFARLASLIKRCRRANEELDRLLHIWLKEYYAVNDFAESFPALLKTFELTADYPELLADAQKKQLSFVFLGQMSSYPMEKSKFLKGENRKLLEKCFDTVMHNFIPLFSLYGLKFEQLVEGRTGKAYWWRLFHGAVYHPVVKKDKTVKLSEHEYYTCQDGLWSYYRPVQNNTELSMIVGYLIKRIEAQLRTLMKHRYHLSVDDVSLRNVLLYERGPYQAFWKVMCDPYFDQLIDSATATYYHQWKENPDVRPEKVKSPIAKKISKQLGMEPYRTFCAVWSEIKSSDFDHQSAHFLAQAKRFAAVEDQGEMARIPASMETPSYMGMNIEELRAYFIWRTKWRAGEKPEAIAPFIKLHAAELTCGVGAADPQDVLEKLSSLLFCYEKAIPSIKKLLVSHIKDYYICQGMVSPFDELVKSLHLESFYTNTLLAMKSYGSWYGLLRKMSDYEIEKSRFFSSEKEPIIAGCFNEVMGQVLDYFDRHQIVFFDLMLKKTRSDYAWRPFSSGVFLESWSTGDRVAELSPHEIYHCKDGYWWCEKYPEEAPGAAQLVGYLMKRTESQLRRLTQDKYKLSPKIAGVISALSARKEKWTSAVIKAINSQEFDQIIDEAVAAYIRQHYPEFLNRPASDTSNQYSSDSLHHVEVIKREPIKVQIDKGLLNEIREKAAQNQEKLLNYGAFAELDERAVTEDVPTAEEAFSTGEVTGADEIIGPVGPEDQCLAASELAAEVTLPPESGWNGLRQALTACEKEALTIIAAGAQVGERIFSLAGSHGIMREVLFECINEKALDFVGDSLIEGQENDIFIYEDYQAEVKAMLIGS